ncbi:hypothetical protein DFH07DRAFT_875512 [Mycena maculata]|uniref:Ubiquitin 3 binding protein But2 C-terminal domain-containing protein n=1 Tax=Mycena maculata TaxID=230809 RepID=A0AAD7NYV8_9AGAR|nr:hypothetical protein DFH07DRAFT_875512 [Mycena maculata]
MTEYTPLMSTPPDEYEVESKNPNTEHPPRYSLLFSLLIALVAVAAAAAFHLSVLSETHQAEPLLRTTDIESSLRVATPSPNLDKGHAIMRDKKFKFPRMVFPASMVRANAAEPDMVYESGSSVVLSPTDSMIYHWRTNSSWPKCYLTGWVSPAADLTGRKSYTWDGDVTAIQIWNLSAPADRNALKTLSWNTRPSRLSLLGTVNFTDRAVQNGLGHLDGQEIKAPTPRFDCLGDTEITVELTCTACRLEFQQVFSMPPLGFELMQLA